MSTSAGLVMGVMYLSTYKLEFCSDNLSYKEGDETKYSYYKLPTFSFGGTRRYQEGFWVLQQSLGSCSSYLNTISLLFSATFQFLLLQYCFCGPCGSTFIHKSPPHIHEVHIPEEVVHQLASGLRIEINRGFTVLRNIASGRDLKKFLLVIAGLWVLSKVGSSCNFLTLIYIATVILFTVPALYEKYEDKVDDFGEKAIREVKKQYIVFDAKVLSKVMSKIPKGAFYKKMD